MHLSPPLVISDQRSSRREMKSRVREGSGDAPRPALIPRVLSQPIHLLHLSRSARSDAKRLIRLEHVNPLADRLGYLGTIFGEFLTRGRARGGGE